ncbi:MAG TPA: tetratricopeptide repeat protein [Saprospiraceae bacterium]|nr:tetratricopeptide repeat protein [Saprospiraceae bacterium]HMP23883.1 tetratricopeptide repeat protein [Saprospiraceae bacterium]
MRYFLTMLALLAGMVAYGQQDARLAQQYFQNGEYEKAAVMYEKLFNINPDNDFYFDRYIDCLLATEAFSECEKIIKQQIRRNPSNVNLYVTYGKLYERQYREEEAAAQYQQAIANLSKDPFIITRLANAFVVLTKYDQAIETYERGAVLLKDQNIFAYNLGELYRRKGDIPRMVESYLNALDANADRIGTVQTIFQRYFLTEDYDELQRQLYTRLQKNENTPHFIELLTWVFVQRKDYKNALRQVRALDRRLRENGGRVYQLGEIAANDKDYETAIEAYEYVAQKGIESPFYLEARRESLRVKRTRLADGYNYTRPELLALEKEYETFLNEFGRSRITAGIILELAELEALYLNNLDKAIELLTELLAYPNVDKNIEASAKLSLADYYLIKGEIWESTLLYSQVDKAFKEDPMGHEARFRNARLSYFTGDFQWAQAQFDILKASTSKLISNDAIDMSVFIMDNLGLDTTARALQMFAEAELLVFQNRFAEAFRKLDSLLVLFPKHALDDDVLYLKGRIHYKKRDYAQAAVAFQKIVDDYATEIKADNALFELAQIYERHLEDIDKAKELYEKMFVEYSGSTFAVEARKRYRILRGDTIQ